MDYLTSINHLTKLEDFNIEIKNFILDKLKKDYEDLDDKLFEEIKKNKTHKVKEKKSRTLITPYGKICFKRRAYVNNLTKKYFFVLDEKLKITKRVNYSNVFLSQIQKDIINGEFIIEKLRQKYQYKISAKQFRILLQRIKKNLLFENKKITLDDTKNLYINVDDTFIKFKQNSRKKKSRIRLYVFHQGKDKQTNKLINFKYYIKVQHRMTASQNEGAELNKNEVLNIINNFYKSRPKNLILCSDGAREFCQLAKKLKCPHNLDKWHLLHAKFFRIFNPNKKYYDNVDKQTRKFFYKKLMVLSNQKVIDLLNVVKEYQIIFFNNNNNSKIALGLKKLVGYITNNLNAIKFWKNKNYYPTTTESFVFHKIKSLLGNKNKAYSQEIFLSMLLIKSNYENNC